MTSTTVDGPDGQRWEVRRRWARGRSLNVIDRFAERRRRISRDLVRASRDSEREAASGPFVPAGNATVEVVTNSSGLAAIGVGAAALVGWVFLSLGELALRAVLLPIALVGHLVFRRPWVVEATGEWVETVRREVAGWTASRRAVDRLVADLRSGAVTRPLTLDGKHPAEHVDHAGR